MIRKFLYGTLAAGLALFMIAPGTFAALLQVGK